MRRLVFLVLLMSVASAASWQEVTFISISVSAFLIASVFMIGFGFGISSLQMMAREEFFQLIAMAVLVVLLLGADGILNGISGVFSPSTSLQQLSLNILSEDKASVSLLISQIGIFDLGVSKEASRTSQCSMMYTGYSVSGCGGYAMLAPQLSMAGGIAGFALAELSAAERLIQIANSYSLGMLLPIGIILRTFKITRGAGGFLIALGISLYLLLPVGIVFNEMLVETFRQSDDPRVVDYTMPAFSASVVPCNPGDATPPPFGVDLFGEIGSAIGGDLGLLLGSDTNEERAIGTYGVMRLNTRNKMMTMLLEATFGPIIGLLLVVSGIRTLTLIAGSDVDVSALARFV